MWFSSFILLLRYNIYIFFFFYWRIVALPYWVGFCHTPAWISHKFTYPLPPNPRSHLPPRPAPLACHRALGWAPCHAAHLHLLSLSHMIIYVFLCDSLNSSHPLFILLCPQICPLWLCSIAAPQIGSSMPFQIPYACSNIHNICPPSFWLTSPCVINSRFFYLIRSGSDVLCMLKHPWIPRIRYIKM